MNLNLWIQKNLKFQKEFADMLGVSEVRLSRLVNGTARPTPEEIGKIENITSGKVKERDFR